MPQSPFGADTLPLDAIVPTDNRQKPPSPHELAAAFAGDVLTLPAVLVPPGGTPPAGEWLNFGVMPALASTGINARKISAQNPINAAPVGQKPETRHHHPRSRAPAPHAGQDPAEAGAKQWQRMRTKQAASKQVRDPNKP